MSGGGSSGQSTSQTIQKADPWEAAQPFLKQIFGEAQRLYEGRPYGTVFQAQPGGGGIGLAPGFATGAGVGSAGMPAGGTSTALQDLQDRLGRTPQYMDFFDTEGGTQRGPNPAYADLQRQIAEAGTVTPLPGSLVPAGGTSAALPPAGGAPAGMPAGGATDPQSIFAQSSPQFFPSSTVSPFAPESQLALTAQANRAISGSPLTAAGQGAVGSAASGAFMFGNPAYSLFDPIAQGQASNPALGYANQFASTPVDIPSILNRISTGEQVGANPALGYANPIATGQVGAQAPDALWRTAAGDYLNSNPYLDAMFEKAAGKTRATVDSAFAAGGRYGSGAHAGTLTEGIGNLATDIYGRNYETERANQLAAQNALMGLSQQNIGNRLAATGQIGSLSAQERANQLAAAQAVGGLGATGRGQQIASAGLLGQTSGGDLASQMAAAGQIGNLYGGERAQQLQAAGLAPQLAREDYFDIGQLGAAGQQRQGQSQQELNDAIARWNFNQTREQSKLADFLGMIGGNYGGTTTAQMNQPLYGNAAMGALGGAATTAGLANSLGLFNSPAAFTGGGLAMGDTLGASALAGGGMNPWLIPLLIGGGLMGSGKLF